MARRQVKGQSRRIEHQMAFQPDRPLPLDDLADLLHGHEHPGFVAGEALKPEVLVPTVAPGEGVRVAVGHHVQQDSMAPGFVGDDAGLLQDVVHQQTAYPEALCLEVKGHPAEEQDRNLAVARRASGRLGHLGDIHRADIDGVIAEDRGLARQDGDIDPGHVVLLLLIDGQLEDVVQPHDTAVEAGAVMPPRIPVFDVESGLVSQHAPRGAGMQPPP